MSKKVAYDLQKLLDDMQTFVGILDLEGRLLFVNNSPLKQAGIEAKDVLGLKLWDTFWFNYDVKAQAIARKDIKMVASGKPTLSQVMIQMKDGPVWIEFSIHPVRDENGKIYQFVPEGRIITKRKQAEEAFKQLNADLENRVKIRTKELEAVNEKLKGLSETDPLTKIANRRSYELQIIEEVASAKRAGQPLALMIIDIDYFKAFNDNYGHIAGDLALCNVAQSITDSLPRATDHLSRFGGEEFVVLLPATNVKGAFRVAETIRTNIMALAIDHQFSNVAKCLTVSIGLASLKSDELTGGQLFKRADSALFAAKKKGRNQCIYNLIDQTEKKESDLISCIV